MTADKTDLYYINKRIDTTEANISANLALTAANLKAGICETNDKISETEALIRGDIESIKVLFYNHLRSCEEKMYKMDDKLNQKSECLLKSGEEKLSKIEERIAEIEKETNTRFIPLEKLKTQLVILVIAVGALLELLNLLK